MDSLLTPNPMSEIVNQSGETVSAAGRPDFGKLAQMGVITLGPDGWPVGSAKNPVIGTRTIRIRVDGVKTNKDIPIQGGHAKNVDFPIWRAGLNPEKYHAMVMREAEIQATTGNRKMKVAPDLEPLEAEDYLNWLDEQNIEQPSSSVLQPIEDAKEEVLAKTIAKNKKAAGAKTAPKKAAGRPKKVVEEVPVAPVTPEPTVVTE